MARRRRRRTAPTAHTIHISIHKGRLNYVHEPVKFSSSNPEDGPIAEVDRNDTVTWVAHNGRNYSIVFQGNTPLTVGGVDTFVFGGASGTSSQIGTVKNTNGSFKYVVTVTHGAGVITDDPEIVVT